jgi:hypothetical protein
MLWSKSRGARAKNGFERFLRVPNYLADPLGGDLAPNVSLARQINKPCVRAALVHHRVVLFGWY